MAKCKFCSKHGLFLKINGYGECSQCEERRLQNRTAYLANKRLAAQAELNSIPVFDIWYSGEKRSRRSGYDPISFSNITPKGRYEDFVVIDTETTGLSPSKDRIVELAAIRYVNQAPVELFETLINPQKEIPASVTNINKITNEMVADAPTIAQVLPSFEAFVSESALVAHNLEFDIKFLFYAGSTIADSKRKYYDTLTQARKILKSPKEKYNREYNTYELDIESEFDVYDYKLETLCDYYGITTVKAHRAAADALATGKLFLSLIEDKQSSC